MSYLYTKSKRDGRKLCNHDIRKEVKVTAGDKGSDPGTSGFPEMIAWYRSLLFVHLPSAQLENFKGNNNNNLYISQDIIATKWSMSPRTSEFRLKMQIFYYTKETILLNVNKSVDIEGQWIFYLIINGSTVSTTNGAYHGKHFFAMTNPSSFIDHF